MQSATWRGLTLGGVGPYFVTSWEGFDDLDTDAAAGGGVQRHGGYPSGGWAQPREVTLQVAVDGGGLANVDTRVAALKRAFAPASAPAAEEPLDLVTPSGRAMTLFCRCVARSRVALTHMGEAVMPTITMRLSASDPRLYSPERQASAEVFTPATGGLAWPASWPALWNAAALDDLLAVNAGTFDTWPTFELAGPTTGALTNPTIEDITNGAELAFTADGGLSIGAGQTLTVDTAPATRDITLDGGNRWNTLDRGSRFTPLAPGQGTYRLRVGAGDTDGATLTIRWRDAEL
jgi:hypothetical protein